MVTPKQLEANRLNAQKSTGPRSVAGKAVSSQNALKTGLRAGSLIIRGESREDLDALIDSFYRQYQPQTPQYRLLVDDLIRNSWYLERYDRIEGEFWNNALGTDENSAFMHETMAKNGPFYKHLRGCVATTERNIRVLIDQLQKPALNQPREFALPDVAKVPEAVTYSVEPPAVPAPPVEPVPEPAPECDPAPAEAVVEVPELVTCSPEPATGAAPPHVEAAPQPAPIAQPAAASVPAPAEVLAQPAENNDTTRRNGFVWKNGIEAFVREAHEHLLFNQRPLREEDLDKIPADRLPGGLEEAC